MEYNLLVFLLFLPFSLGFCSGYLYILSSFFLQTNIKHMRSSLTKPTKSHEPQAKTQISLRIHPVWVEPSLSTWRIFGFLDIHKAHSEDWSDWTDAQPVLGLLWTHQSFCWFCVLWLKWDTSWENLSSEMWDHGLKLFCSATEVSYSLGT